MPKANPDLSGNVVSTTILAKNTPNRNMSPFFSKSSLRNFRKALKYTKVTIKKMMNG